MQKTQYKRIKGSFEKVIMEMMYYDQNYYVLTISIKQKTYNIYEAVISFIVSY